MGPRARARTLGRASSRNWTLHDFERQIQGMQFTVTVSHDETEGVWFIQSSDVPGLNAEANTLDALVEAIADLAPDLVSTNIPNSFSEGATTISLCVQHLLTADRAHAA